MHAVAKIAFTDQISVRQQHRKIGLVSAKGDPVNRQHIGTIREVGDATKTLGFALGAERTVGDVQALEREVCGRVERGGDRELCGACSQCRGVHGDAIGRLDVISRGERPIIQRNQFQRQSLAKQHQRFCCVVGEVLTQRQRRGDAREQRLKIEYQIDLVYQKARSTVATASDHYVFRIFQSC